MPDEIKENQGKQPLDDRSEGTNVRKTRNKIFQKASKIANDKSRGLSSKQYRNHKQYRDSKGR